MLLGACGSSSAQPPGSSSSSASTPASTRSTTPSGAGAVCGPATATTLAADARARVYATGGQVYGCAAAVKRRSLLGSQASCLRAARVGPLALAGMHVAYGLQRCGVDTGRATITVRRLDTGRVLSDRPATTSPVGVESYVSVTAIVVSAHGGVAWITRFGSIVGHRRGTEVHLADAHGERMLDSGSGIAAGSLTLKGTQLRWRDGARWRTARLA